MAIANTTFHGVNISWGTPISSSAFATCIVQSGDADSTADMTPIKNQYGYTVATVQADPKRNATFSMIISNASAAAGDATVTKPNIGDLITVTTTSDSLYAGTNWIVTDVSVKATNTSAAVLDIKAVAFPAVTT